MRILIADSRTQVRFALRVLLSRQPNIEVVGEARYINDLLAQAKCNRPDLIVLGWELLDSSNVSPLSALRTICPNVWVVALSGRLEARQAALDAGADAFVSKTDPPEHLLAAIGSMDGPALKQRRR